MTIYATFAPSPLGQDLALAGAGHAVTTTGDSLSRSRAALGSTAARPAAASGVECVVTGANMLVTLGVVSTTVTSTEPGTSGGSFGWRLDAGQVLQSGSIIATGLPVPDFGQAVGLLLDLQLHELHLYLGRQRVHVITLSAAQAAMTWRFAVGLGSTVAGDCTCTINTGGTGAATPALMTGGWYSAPTTPAVHRLASEDWLTGADDTPAHARYEGVLDPAGIDLVAAVSFWPWASASSAAAAGEVPILDAAGWLDDAGNTPDARVSLRQLVPGQPLADATPLGRFTAERVTVTGDMSRSLQLGDALSALDDPLPRELYLPSAGKALAWTAQPIVIGACRSVPLQSVNSDGSLQWVSDAPCLLDDVRERGRSLAAGTDYTPDASHQALQLVSPPVSGLIADVSSVGTAGADIWQGGVAHPGTLGASKAALVAGAAARYRLHADVPAGGRLIVSLTDDTAGTVLVLEHGGDYEGTLVNAGDAAATVYLIGQGGATAVDVSIQPLAAGMAPAPLALALREVFRRARFGGWSLDDAAAIDTATGYAGIGLYAAPGAVTARQLYQQALASYGAAAWQDADGTLRIARLVDPADQPAAFALGVDDLVTELHRQPDMAPQLTTRMTYRPNIQPLSDGDISTDTVAVPADRRTRLQAAAQGTVWSGVELAPRYAAAAAAAPAFASRFDHEADAQAEIDRICELYAVERNFYVASLVDLARTWQPGQCGTLTYPRHGLAAWPVLVTRVRHNPVTGDTELTLWG